MSPAGPGERQGVTAKSSMSHVRERFDIFICGDSQHVPMLKPLLRKLHPAGIVHLGSSFLTPADLAELDGLYDVLHTPAHSTDGYQNFELFCVRDINRLTTAPYFVKLDADTHLEPDWINYVEECIAAQPEAVLFGPRMGDIDVTFQIAGPLVRQLLGRDIRVTGASKVIGGFYVGNTAFFHEHRRFMEVTHELLWCYRDGVRQRSSLYPEHWPADDAEPAGGLTILGRSKSLHGANEDSLRNLVVHANGAGHRLHVIDSGGRVQILRPPATAEQLARGRMPILPSTPRWKPHSHPHRPSSLQE